MKFKNLFNNKLWIKFFIAFSILLLILVTSMTILWNGQFVKTIQEQTFSQFANATRDANNNLENDILSIYQVLDTITSNPETLYHLKNISHKESREEIETLFSTLASVNSNISGLIFLKNDSISVSVGSTFIDKNFFRTPVLKKIKNSKYESSSAFVDVTSEYFRLYRPIYSDGEYVDIIVADVNYDLIRSTFLKQNTLNNATSLLFDQNSNLIYSTNNNIKKVDKSTYGDILDKITYSNHFYSLEYNINDCRYFGVAFRSNFTGLSNVILTPIENINNSYFKSSSFKLLILESFLFFILALFISNLLANNIITRINKLKNNMLSYTLMIDKPEIIDSDNIVIKDELDECQLAYTEMLNHIRNQLNCIYTLNDQRRLLEINALEAQLNPHFLYNTLNTIRYLADNKNTIGISKLSEALIDLLQFTLRNNNTFVTVEEEIDYLKNYISINTLNTQNQLNVQYNIHDEITKLRIPKMILQPIVENCFKHALRGTSNDIIIIKGYIIGADLEFKIIDNGLGISPDDLEALKKSLNAQDIPSQKIGLSNINKRLKILYGSTYGLDVFSVENVQTIVTVKLPIISEEKEDEA